MINYSKSNYRMTCTQQPSRIPWEILKSNKLLTVLVPCEMRGEFIAIKPGKDYYDQ